MQEMQKVGAYIFSQYDDNENQNQNIVTTEKVVTIGGLQGGCRQPPCGVTVSPDEVGTNAIGA